MKKDTLKNLTLEYLNECFCFDPDKGELVWKERPLKHFKSEFGWKVFNSRYAGVIVGHTNSTGYTQVRIGAVKYKLHRIAYWLYTGEKPDKGKHIDHINGNRSDNRKCNLRLVTAAANMKNQSVKSCNTSGVMGVDWHKNTNSWRARITVNYRKIHLGYFDKKEDAIKARKEAEVRFGYHKNHGRKRIARSLEADG